MQRLAAVLAVHEPPAHGDQRVGDVVEDARQLQGMDAAVGERQIDGSPGVAAAAARIGAAFVYGDFEAEPAQQNGEQRAGGTAAYDVQRPVHGRIARDNRSTAVNTSP